MTVKCEFCDSIFVNDNSLKNHQRVTKYCLVKQKKQIKCEYCNELSFSQIDFESHQNNCIIFLKSKLKELQEENRDIQYYQLRIESYEKQLLEKHIQFTEKENFYKNQLVEKENQIKHLQDEIISVNKIAVSKPTNMTMNNINNKITNMNILNLNEENIKNIIDERYNLDVISEGQKCMAKFTTENILKDSNGQLNYVCTDPSRKIFKYKNDSGEIEKDVDAQKLTNILTDNGIFVKTSKLTTEHWTRPDGSIDNNKFAKLIEKTLEINSIKDDNTIFKNYLAKIISI